MVVDGVVVLMLTVCAEEYVPPAGLKVGATTVETVTVAVPITLPLAAIMVALPCDIADARPADRDAITDGLLEDQFTWLVTSVELESL
jgi:hypothetical protein